MGGKISYISCENTNQIHSPTFTYAPQRGSLPKSTENDQEKAEALHSFYHQVFTDEDPGSNPSWSGSEEKERQVHVS